MDKVLKEQYLYAMFRFTKVGMILPQKSDLNMTELIIMKGVAENSSFTDNNISTSEIQSKLHITKSAISQAINSLEKKGYIERKIDTADRRKIIVTLTQTGENSLNEIKEFVNQILEEAISRLGSENTKQLTVLLNQASDTFEDLKSEIVQNDKKYDNEQHLNK
ncbi:MarR family winged helix-turn-helix transcriptional regulator [Tissierella creatinophila]|uniref:HTH-type transcriptional regulator MgrA n=1 Tax=Tissierella creatinophila DSM 6911 TaxID=1123403 RepID=A0A1U7M3N0_TISCR|nr:MarR family transcriptional regulator [Tissierella creatinophila]OLS01924.1 transcriptional regulator SlyA [Tissierella creatinophila DSM 6911]